MSGYLKIGYSRDVRERIRELASTGVPLPFEVEYSRPSLDVEVVEQLVHSALDSTRASTNREFFKIDLAYAVRIVEEHIRPVRDEPFLSERAKVACAPPQDAPKVERQYFADKWAKARAERDAEVRRNTEQSKQNG